MGGGLSGDAAAVGRREVSVSAINLTALRAAAEGARPGKREQLSGKYMAFDFGEDPQVFRAMTQEEEEQILAFDRETCLRLVAIAKCALAPMDVLFDGEHFYDCLPGKRGAAPSLECSRACVLLRRLREALTGVTA